MPRGFRSFVLAIVGSLMSGSVVDAADLKIVDTAGLIRAVRVVKDSSRVTVVVADQKGASGECIATNVDGIASERRETVSKKGECTFQSLAAGTWQITVTSGARWRVRIDD